MSLASGGDAMGWRAEPSAPESAAPQPAAPAPELREALKRAVSRLDEAERQGRPDELAHALMPVAACYRSMGALGAAEDALRQALRCARATRSVSLQVAVLCDLAETACGLALDPGRSDAATARAARDRARDEAFEAASLASSVMDGDWSVRALLRVSDVLNRCGDHDDAACLQARALQLMHGR
jgi:tetratricopeptide (TPR) repeat protein